MLSLFVYLSDGEPQTVSLPDPGSVTVGRAEPCDVQLIDPCTSSQHCRFEGREGRPVLAHGSGQPERHYRQRQNGRPLGAPSR